MKKSIYIMALGAFGIITTEFGVIGILPSIAKEFGISIGTASWLLSGFALTIALTGPFAVLATSTINKKTLMLLSMLLFVVSNAVSGYAQDFMVMMIARILPAVLQPVFWSVAVVAATRQVTPDKATQAVSIITGGISLASVLGVPLTSYVAELVGWRYSFFISGAVNLIAFGALNFFIPSMPVREKVTIKGQLRALKAPQLWVSLVTTMTMIAGMFASYSFLAELLGKETRMSGAQISAMLLLFGTAGVGGNWLTGKLLGYHVQLTTRGFLLSLIAVYMLAYFFSGYFLVMSLIIAVWGFIHTGGFLIGQINTTREAPSAPELATSLMTSFANAGISIGTALGGITIASLPVQYVLLTSAGLITSAYLMTFLRFPKQSCNLAGRVKADDSKEDRSCLCA